MKDYGWWWLKMNALSVARESNSLYFLDLVKMLIPPMRLLLMEISNSEFVRRGKSVWEGGSFTEKVGKTLSSFTEPTLIFLLWKIRIFIEAAFSVWLRPFYRVLPSSRTISPLYSLCFSMCLIDNSALPLQILSMNEGKILQGLAILDFFLPFFFFSLFVTFECYSLQVYKPKSQ